MEIREDDLAVLMGIIVDSVSEVLNVAVEDLEPTPFMGVSVDTAFIMAMAKGKGMVRALMDIDRVFTSEELELLVDE